MQKLKFEAAWDKTLADKDRQEIQEIFTNSIPSLEDELQFTTVWIAENYKEELLVTALIHNQSNTDVTFNQTAIQFLDGNTVLGEHTFTIKPLRIEPKTSMPWTFIFPASSFELPDTIEEGILRLKNE
ncbi:SLAP domain-containing protein [Salirhabdus sp. Marseille-P4669]|uniref:SLAP domain-containing protein n=1 Tax=Salirhabdus sp. Marseille-P4669 TaxID=2042310 RepID=UPI000C7CC41F|nr:SLAP domain-containing protein [Salirhabdus sp. Marseille-P4669]